ncbi:MAG: hypothetical protein QXL77_08065 [Candidatus Bathyarchaeia archaeon]
MVERHIELLMPNTTQLTPSGDYELLQYLKSCLDEAAEKLSAKFGLVDAMGRPRKAFIIDALLRFGCVGCIRKVFTQMRKQSADNLYLEMHSLAVNLLAGVLTHALCNPKMEVLLEENGRYGRVDVAIKTAAFGAVVEIGNVSVIVEVKTGRNVDLIQVLRYLLEYPKAALLVWRVRKRQVFIVKGERLTSLLCMCAAVAIGRALKLLNNCDIDCPHNPHDTFAIIEKPQELIDEYFDGLADGLPKVVSAVFKALNEEELHAG